jgi:hypothetical protein
MKFIKKHKEQIVDISILVLTIIFTLHIENKFDTIAWVKNYYWLLLIVVVIIIIGLTFFKVIIDRKEKNYEKENVKLQEDNKYLQSLISSFKYQISKPLEDELHAIFVELGLNSNHRITVYTYTNGCFFSIGRYSSNQNYTSFGRIAIDDKDEFIFKVWNGEANCDKLTIDKQRKMPTKKICAHFLYEKNEAHPEKDRIGLIVFESTEGRNKQFNNGKFTEHIKRINTFIHENINIKQDLNFAIQEGL